MKLQTLPVKRRPVPKGIFRRLSAVTRNKKQRVAAAAAPVTEMEADDGGSKISRALTIIFLIHIVAIGLIFVHQRFLDGRPTEISATVKSTAAAPAAAKAAEVPRFSSGEKPYAIQEGDNYTRIAAAQGVEEEDLRRVNGYVEIRPGLLIKIPPKRIVAEEPPEVTAIRENTPSDTDRGLVEAVDVTNAPKAQLVRPNTTRAAQAQTMAQSAPRSPAQTAQAPAASGKSYVVQPGDSIWRIANRFKISQDKLMQVNGISDARKMKNGMKLVIPQS